MPVVKVCEQCKKQFSIPPRRSEAVRFCSKACKDEAGWRTLTCPTCGETFRRKRSDHPDSSVSFCSKRCYHASRIGEPVRNKRSKTYAVCRQCGVRFQITSTRIGSARWCSRKCQSESPEWRSEMSEKQQGDKHWRWAGGLYKTGTGYVRHKRKANGSEVAVWNHRIVVLKAMLESDPDHPFLIEVDGVKKLNPEIEVHHIDRNRSNNDLSNLLAVTKQAHAQIHHRNRKPNPWECWPPNPVTW